MKRRIDGALIAFLAALGVIALIVLSIRPTPSSGPVQPSGTPGVPWAVPSLSGAPRQMSGTVSPSSSGAPTPHPSGGLGDATSYFKAGYGVEPTPRVVVSKGTGDTLRGSATWYAWHPGEAAAGPGLRAWLGADWRGKVVTVIAPGCTCAPIVVRLTDWCLCGGGRIIDLDRRSFAALIDPSFGVISVLISEGAP